LEIFAMRFVLAVAALVGAALPAAATQVRDCDYAASVKSIAEPWERNIRGFYNNAVRVAVLDTGGEPVCCSQHLLVLLPDRAGSQPGMDEERLCRVVGDHDASGFLRIEFRQMRARYDRRGLLIEFPVQIYGDGIRNRRSAVRVRIDVARGTVTAE
jgi:hypothetical protein